MTDTQYDPTGYTVDEVNDYLANADEAERDRVLQAERDGKARKGIVEGPTGAQGAPAPDKSPAGLQAQREADQAQVRETGFLGETGETPEGTEPVRPASESAPEGVSTKREDGVAVLGADETPELATAPTTIADQDAPDLEGEHYQQGYLGEVQSTEDLTLAAVTGQKS